MTEELAGAAGSGGIGAAFFELARMLARSGYAVDVLYCPLEEVSTERQESLAEQYLEYAIKLTFLDASRFVAPPFTPEKRAYAVCRSLEAEAFDVVHFHDYKGLGFFATAAKHQGLAFADTVLVVQLHGPTRWTMSANEEFFVHEDQLRVDFMERESIRRADHVVSPSQYLVDWLLGHEVVLPTKDRVAVIKNVCTHLVSTTVSHRRASAESPTPPRRRPERHGVRAEEQSGQFTDLVVLARHEERKGLLQFFDALDVLGDELESRRIHVHFFGKLGTLEGRPSLLQFVWRSEKWPFEFSLRTNLDRDGVARELRRLRRPLVVVPSPYENSPYAVLEVLTLGIPLVASLQGGGPELVEPNYPGLFRPVPGELERVIAAALDGGLAPAELRQPADQTERDWLSFHTSVLSREPPPAAGPRALPKVCLGITHFERPAKLLDAVVSALRQSYPNVEVIVVDDGSPSEDTREALDEAATFFRRSGVRLIRRENGYLGAARNTILANTDAEYVCFLDDDDYAYPEMVSTLVAAATASGADVVTCANVYMEERSRHTLISEANRSEERKASYVPMGGPASLAMVENCLGSAVSLMRTESLKAIGGYTELRDVGHEDYELYLRLTQAGYRLEAVPRALYLYEVGRPSMLTRTSLRKSFRRTFDAIEFSRNVGAVKDIMSLRIGRFVAENEQNRHWWLASMDPQADLIRDAMHAGTSIEHRFERCIRLARAKENYRCAQALAAELRRMGSSLAVEEDDVLIRAPAGAPSKPVYSPTHRSILLDIALGRHDASLDGVTRLFVREGRVPVEDVEFSFRVVAESCAHVSASQLLELANAMMAARFAASERDTVMCVVGAVLARVDALKGSSVVRALLERCAARYLELNLDVSNAFGAGSSSKALEHYRTFGIAEKRSGFERLEELVTRADKLGVLITAREVLDCLDGPLGG